MPDWLFQFKDSLFRQKQKKKKNPFSSITQPELLSRVDALNRDPSIHGILVQMPLGTASANTIDERLVTDRIDPDKDVDGLCTVNQGRLAAGGGKSEGFLPCTPAGCMDLIKRSGVEVRCSLFLCKSDFNEMFVSARGLHRGGRRQQLDRWLSHVSVAQVESHKLD